MQSFTLETIDEGIVINSEQVIYSFGDLEDSKNVGNSENGKSNN